MTFLTLDFETATSLRNSACEIGLTWVSNGQIERTEAYLIQPPYNDYDHFNTDLHGIGPRDTANAPTFAQLWPTLASRLGSAAVVAHNAGSDMSVLRQSLDLCFSSHDELCIH